MRLLGILSVAHVEIPLFHKRRLQRWLIHSPAETDHHCSSLCRSQLELPGESPRPVIPLDRVTAQISVSTDTSLSGWGGMCMSDVVGGQWLASTTLHINTLELLSVYKVTYWSTQTTRVRQLTSTAREECAPLASSAWPSGYCAGLTYTCSPYEHFTSPGCWTEEWTWCRGVWCLHPDLASQMWSKFGRTEGVIANHLWDQGVLSFHSVCGCVYACGTVWTHCAIDHIFFTLTH